ncbi:MAG: Zn-dependent alcohol dehydrogenase [Deltaproteobacteria bacterium]|nr:Zn-dependent alcohol dehydrogenase [Deltaproteobacteria bacterium]
MDVKAAVAYELKKPLVVETLELDEPGDGEVLLKIMASGICHSDDHVRMGNYPTPLPMVLGHEGGCIVEKCGPNVSKVKEGDHCVATWMPACHKCDYCVDGKSYLCERGAGLLDGCMLDGSYRFHTKDGQNVGQMHYLGTFTEYTVVPEESVVVIDKDLPLEKACIVGCAVPTGWGSAVRRAQVKPGSTVLVVGGGGIGTSAIQGARLAGARMIILADTSDEKLEMHKKLGFGATHFINNAKEDLPEKIAELTNGRGVDYAFEAIGTKPTQAQVMEVTGKGGTSVFIGNESFFSESLPTSPEHFALWSKNLLGILYGGCNTLSDIPFLLNLYKEGHLNLDDMITKEYRLEDINVAFDDMLAGKNIRGVVRFD